MNAGLAFSYRRFLLRKIVKVRGGLEAGMAWSRFAPVFRVTGSGVCDERHFVVF